MMDASLRITEPLEVFGLNLSWHEARYRRQRFSLQDALPMGISILLFLGSFMPWLSDPLGGSLTSWQLPLESGWLPRLPFLNYGLLSTLIASYVLLFACAQVWLFKKRQFRGLWARSGGYLCLGLVCWLLLQFLCIDLRGIADLMQHKIQMLLIQQHLGYNLPRDRITLSPFTLNNSTLYGRLSLLIDQLSWGVLCPLIGGWLLLWQARFRGRTLGGARGVQTRRLFSWRLILLLAFLFVIGGRGPLSQIFEYEARLALNAGTYIQALNWLTVARTLNPDLEQVAYYHIERGEALYLLHSEASDADTRAYLAAIYREQRDWLDAYQEELGLWKKQNSAPWVIDELSLTLENLSEYPKPLSGSVISRQDRDDTSIFWLRALTVIEPNNHYALYLQGRIACDQRAFVTCSARMSQVLRSSGNPDLQSSALTYLALSAEGQGQYKQARTLLFQALRCDPGYRNNTAREALSGLH